MADRGESSTLRGRLSQIYLPALLSSETEPLTQRLGDRATLDEPLFGHSSGSDEIGRTLRQLGSWLTEKKANFEEGSFLTGSDREVTEGVLSLTREGQPVRLPVAVVAEKRREREVALRVYYSTKPLREASQPRPALLPDDEVVWVPPPVERYLEALAYGDVDAVVASFENGATVQSPDGVLHAKLDGGGPLREYFASLLSGGDGPSKGISVLKNARADDGRSCALELTIVRVHGREVDPQGALGVYERGDSGLLRAARLYGDLA